MAKEQEIVWPEHVAERVVQRIESLQPKKVTVRQAMSDLHQVIVRALERGVPEADIRAALEEQGIKLNARNFRRYLDEGKPGKGGQGSAERGRQAGQEIDGMGRNGGGG